MDLNLTLIRNEMFIARITGVKMAELLEMSQTSFYKKINGHREFTAKELGTIASTLKKDVNFFYK